jgi:hypothetical protein
METGSGRSEISAKQQRNQKVRAMLRLVRNVIKGTDRIFIP